MIQISGPLFLSNYCSTLPDLVEAIRNSFFTPRIFKMFRRKSAPRNLTGFWKTVIPHINVTSSVKVIGFPQVGNQSSVLYKGKFFCVRWFLFQFFSPLKSPSSNFPFFYISPLPSQLAEVSNSQI